MLNDNHTWVLLTYGLFMVKRCFECFADIPPMQNEKVIAGEKTNATSSKNGIDVAGKTIENMFNKNHIWGAPYVLPVYGEKVLVTQRGSTIINDERRKIKKLQLNLTGTK